MGCKSQIQLGDNQYKEVYQEKMMKKIRTIIGIGAIAMAVGLSPAFAQQTKPQEPLSPQATVQPKADEKAPLPGSTGKSETGVPAKPGGEVKSETRSMPADHGSDSRMTGTEKRSENTPAKSGADLKTGTVQGKSEAGAKDEKGAAVKSGADVKGTHNESGMRSDAKASSDKASHSHKSSVSSDSSKVLKNNHEKSKDADTKTNSSNPATSSTK